MESGRAGTGEPLLGDLKTLKMLGAANEPIVLGRTDRFLEKKRVTNKSPSEKKALTCTVTPDGKGRRRKM